MKKLKLFIIFFVVLSVSACGYKSYDEIKNEKGIKESNIENFQEITLPLGIEYKLSKINKTKMFICFSGHTNKKIFLTYYCGYRNSYQVFIDLNFTSKLKVKEHILEIKEVKYINGVPNLIFKY